MTYNVTIIIVAHVHVDGDFRNRVPKERNDKDFFFFGPSFCSVPILQYIPAKEI